MDMLAFIFVYGLLALFAFLLILLVLSSASVIIGAILHPREFFLGLPPKDKYK